MKDHIDFEFFRKPLETFFNAGKDYSRGRRPVYDGVLIFKMLVLRRFYNFSDDNIASAILDRLSFMRFLGLTLAGYLPMPRP